MKKIFRIALVIALVGIIAGGGYFFLRPKTSGSYSVGYGDAKETFKVPKQDLDEEWQPNDGLLSLVCGTSFLSSIRITTVSSAASTLKIYGM